MGTKSAMEYVDFYGEDTEVGEGAFIFSELLVQRSQQHEWQIKPHRHRAIAQIFVVTQGGGQIRLDDEDFSIGPGQLMFIPAGVMHGFEWLAQSQGYVISMTKAAVNQLAERLPGWGRSAARAVVTPSAGEGMAELEAVCQGILKESLGKEEYREQMLGVMTTQLVVWLMRLSPKKADNTNLISKPQRKLAQFRSLIQEHASEQHLVAWYASEIGVSQAHLNQICRQYAQSTALALIHQQLLQEAKRFLVFADINISTISERLGFSEPAYFNKFFKRYTGLSPAVYRRNSHV